MINEFTLADQTSVQLFIAPSQEERSALLEHLVIDEHSLSSSLDPDEISRVEFKPSHMLIILKHPKNYSYEEEVRFNVSSAGVFVLPDRLAVILSEDIRHLVDPGSPTRMDCVIGIFSHATRHFLEHLKVIKMVSREIQNKINTLLDNQYLIHMFTLSESLTYYQHAIDSNGVVLRRFRNNAERLALTPEQVELLEDIIIENDQCARQAEIYSSVLSGLMEARDTLTNNNMNVILKNLTIVNTILLPLNLIASIGGMSEYTMMTQGLDWRLSYFLLTIGMVGAAMLMAIGINKFAGWQRKPKE